MKRHFSDIRMMSGPIQIQVELPNDLAEFRFPSAVQRRLQHLLALQDQGNRLTRQERDEAEGLTKLAEFLALLRLRSERIPKRVSAEDLGEPVSTPEFLARAKMVWGEKPFGKALSAIVAESRGAEA